MLRFKSSIAFAVGALGLASPLSSSASTRSEHTTVLFLGENAKIPNAKKSPKKSPKTPDGIYGVGFELLKKRFLKTNCGQNSDFEAASAAVVLLALPIARSARPGHLLYGAASASDFPFTCARVQGQTPPSVTALGAPSGRASVGRGVRAGGEGVQCDYRGPHCRL